MLLGQNLEDIFLWLCVSKLDLEYEMTCFGITKISHISYSPLYENIVSMSIMCLLYKQGKGLGINSGVPRNAASKAWPFFPKIMRDPRMLRSRAASIKAICIDQVSTPYPSIYLGDSSNPEFWRAMEIFASKNIFGRSYVVVPRKGNTYGQQYLIYHKHVTAQNVRGSRVNHTMYYSGLCTFPSMIILSKTK